LFRKKDVEKVIKEIENIRGTLNLN